MTGNQEGEDDFTSSQEPEVADNVTSISLLDRAFLQTKPNSLETELEIENIFSLQIQEICKRRGRNEKQKRNIPVEEQEREGRYTRNYTQKNFSKW